MELHTDHRLTSSVTSCFFSFISVVCSAGVWDVFRSVSRGGGLFAHTSAQASLRCVIPSKNSESSRRPAVVT